MEDWVESQCSICVLFPGRFMARECLKVQYGNFCDVAADVFGTTAEQIASLPDVALAESALAAPRAGFGASRYTRHGPGEGGDPAGTFGAQSSIARRQ